MEPGTGLKITDFNYRSKFIGSSYFFCSLLMYRMIKINKRHWLMSRKKCLSLYNIQRGYHGPNSYYYLLWLLPHILQDSWHVFGTLMIIIIHKKSQLPKSPGESSAIWYWNHPSSIRTVTWCKKPSLNVESRHIFYVIQFQHLYRWIHVNGRININRRHRLSTLSHLPSTLLLTSCRLKSFKSILNPKPSLG